ncbi:alpha/beta fold hydrolase [Brevibacterium spongiae]|uniref:Alpha/beta hydrolase n=1 Tax=Brevibacterium spongiae TaxID=2909672 RepID=A0ABY5SSZ8_9MICO|nr:alpha/beta hydrolase [Brevibacterium spongiae]UVI37710.1 alpha/beta hydrolase [Brevibacterium spongiae]
MTGGMLELIFLHGAGETASAWDEVIASLPEDWTCRAPELAQLGGTESGGFDLEAAAQSVLGIADPDATTVLCGLSLGAMTATAAAAAARPAEIDVLVASGAQVRPPKWMMRVQWHISARLPDSAFTGYGSTKAETLAMYEAVEAADLRDSLGDITVPTAVWCGSRDIANKPASRQLAAGIDGAELRIVSGMGHDWHRSHPHAFAAHLREFIPAALRRG